nr:uncharacterized protein LOC105343662 isoform X2 [Crassostrea gigas]
MLTLMITTGFSKIMAVPVLPMILFIALAGTNDASSKVILQGYLTGQLTGQLSSNTGSNQVDALRREFETFTDYIEKSVKSMKTFKEKAEGTLLKIQGTNKSSVVYTRWGKRSCPTNAEVVLSGFTGGSRYDHVGAAVDPLCLPRDPEWGVYRDGINGNKAYVFGAEYETNTSPGKLPTLHQHDIPCAVCLLRNRSVVKMFPARKTCYKGWKLEYHGYLMAGYYNHPAATMYTCVDGDPDTLHGGHANKNGKLFYSVEARCGSLKCPPYVQGRELEENVVAQCPCV